MLFHGVRIVLGLGILLIFALALGQRLRL